MDGAEGDPGDERGDEAATAECGRQGVGEDRGRDRDDLLPARCGPAPGDGTPEDPGAEDTRDDSPNGAEADLLEEYAYRPRVRGVLLGHREGEEDDEQRHAYAVVEAALDVETLPDP